MGHFQRRSGGRGSWAGAALWAGIAVSGGALRAAVTPVVTGHAADQTVQENGARHSALSSTLRVGQDSLGNAAVFVFQLPALPAGHAVVDAELNVQFLLKAGAPAFNADLYGLGVRASSAVLAGDYYRGAYGGDATDAAALQDNFLTPSSVPGRVRTSAATNAALAQFLKAQYAAGGAGKHVFLRLSPDASTTSVRYYTLASANNPPAQQPLLTLTAGVDPLGYLDQVSPAGLARGWAVDRDVPSQSITVHFHLDSPQGVSLGSIQANVPRPDVNSALGVPGDHGFQFPIPLDWHDGADHVLHALAEDVPGGARKAIGSLPFRLTPHAARFVRQTVPSATAAGQPMEVSITFKNTGTLPWTASTGFKLGSQSPQDTLRWGSRRVTLGGLESVAPDQEKTFTFTATAPALSDTYPFQWRMLQEGVKWFGDATPDVAVAVTDPPHQVLREWTFDDGLQGWWANAEASATFTSGGVLTAQPTGIDPYLMGPVFVAVVPSPRQFVELRLKSSKEGVADIYFSTSPAGFSEQRRLSFSVPGDNAFHTYAVFPYWHREPGIVRLRLDPFPGGQIVIDSIRVCELAMPAGVGPEGYAHRRVRTLSMDRVWLQHAVPPDISSAPWVRLRMKASAGKEAQLYFVTDRASGIRHLFLPIDGDGKERLYEVHAGAVPGWTGRLLGAQLSVTGEPATAVQSFSLEFGDRPRGPELRSFGLLEGLPRAGSPATARALVRNLSPDTLRNLTFTLSVPAGVSITGGASRSIDALTYGEERALLWDLSAPAPTAGAMELAMAGDGVPANSRAAALRFTAPLPPMSSPYVPAPAPATTTVQVGAYYMPAWKITHNWRTLEPYPERMPVLGAYKEGHPEVMDWQIKWAREHGVSFFAFDWFWHDNGHPALEHALHQGFFNAAHRDMMKFCLMLTNHPAPYQITSESELLAVADYWIANYFRRTNYFRIDGKPAVIIYLPANLVSDLGGPEPARKAIAALRKKCEEAAGVGGITLIGNVLSSQANGTMLAGLKSLGFDLATAYNWPGAGMKPGETRSDYEELAAGYKLLWRKMTDTYDAHRVPLIPPISGGWDPRPWHRQETLYVRHGRTPAKFEAHLRDAKELIDLTRASGASRDIVLVEAWNELGEGSYIEPHQEYGFGYLDAVRNVFSTASPLHEDRGPRDIGRALNQTAIPSFKTSWEFDTDGDQEGWGEIANHFDNIVVQGGRLSGVSWGSDPVFWGPDASFPASGFSKVRIFMKVSGPGGTDTAYVFWKTLSSPAWAAERSVAFPVTPGGTFREYEVDLAGSALWTGLVTGLRLDPVNRAGMTVEVDWIRIGS